MRAIRDLERDRSARPYHRSVRLLADALRLTYAQRNVLHGLARRQDGGIGTRLAGPGQLPAAVPQFVGRERELQALDELIGQAGDQPAGGTVVISAIEGTAGIGKTALAVHWAHQASAMFPDGQLYANLRGFDPAAPPVRPAEALRCFLSGLAVPGERIPAEPDAQAALYRSLLAGKRMLIVLDNARDSGQVEPLLPASPGSLVLVTSRSQLSGLTARHGARLLTLDMFTKDEARELLACRLGAGRADAEPQAVIDLIGFCAGLPLALAVITARACARPGFPLAVLAAELRDETTRLDALDAGDEAASVRAAFWWSCRHLSDPAARMFRLLGLHPGPDITAGAAASLAATQLPDARRALAELARAYLLAEHQPGRYACHDLLRGYAVEQALATDAETGRQAATRRLVDYYLHSARAADLLLDPARRPVTIDAPEPGVTAARFEGIGDALAWFDAEHQALSAVIALAAGNGLDSRACQLAWTMETFWRRRVHADELATAQGTALASAQRLGDRAAQAAAQRGAGAALIYLGRSAEAMEHLDQALRLFAEVGDRSGQARAHLTVANGLERQGRYQEALARSRRALQLAEADEDQAVLAAALNNVGWFLAKTGDCQQALGFCERALALQSPTDDRMVCTLDSLAYIHHSLGRHADAARWSRQAVALMLKTGYRYDLAMACVDSGDAHNAAGDLQAARHAWLQAGSLLGDSLDYLDDPGIERARARLRFAAPGTRATSVAVSGPSAPSTVSRTVTGTRSR